MFKKRIPVLLTLLNLSFGVLSIIETSKGNFFISAIFILIAALMDRYDGRIARALEVSSELGKELDSLSDLVSFGVAPALLVFNKFSFLGFDNLKTIGICSLLLYIICGSYRLAKYNISEFNGIFTGVPITLAGFIVALYVLIMPVKSSSSISSIFLLMILSYLMVSKFKFKKI